MKNLAFVLALSLFFAQSAAGEEDAYVDLSGVWKGSTTCPLGLVSYAIEIDQAKGVVRHSGYGPDKKYPLEVPVKLGFMKGWEGVWVRLTPSDPEYDGSFDYLSALVSGGNRILTIRPRHGIGDCRGFQLTRSVIPVNQNSPTPAGPPGKREPTAEEMQKAFETLLHGGSGSLEVNNAIAGVSVTVVGFEKLACTKASGRPGYNCDFLFETDTVYRSNEGSEAGDKHAAAVQQLADWLGSMSNAPKHSSSSGRFLWVEGRGAWVMIKDE